MAGLLGDIKIDGGIVKGAFEGVGGFLKDIKELFTGKAAPLSAEKAAEYLERAEQLEAAVGQGQIEINKIEAANPSVIVSGWRPAIGWVCAAAMACYYVPQSLFAAILWLIQGVAVLWAAPDIQKAVIPVFPLSFNIEEIIGLVMSLLGLGGMRMQEKIKGVARN